jgi:anaerobic selenocysteine-containing dehydrogenase
MIRASACPHDCPSTCALDIEVLGPDRIGAVHGAAGNSYTAGVICGKVSRYAERVHAPDRLTHPLLRTGPKGSGQFRRIGWDEALDRIADRFAERTARLGAETVWPFSYAGTMGLVQRDGIHRLTHAMGYSRQGGTVCSTIAKMGWRAGVGRITGPDPREMADSDLIVMWGGNPVSTQVNVMTHVSRARKARGATFIVIDPYRTGTAQVADTHLMLRPGTDAALACAVMHVAFRDGHADRAYMAAHADDPAALEAHVASRSPEWAAAITGLSVAEIEAFARAYGTTPRSYIRAGFGFTRMRNGAANMHAVTCLPTVTGAWRHPGGGAFWANADVYHIDRTLIEGTDVADPGVRSIDMCRAGRALCGEPAELRGGPPITAMIVQSTNPATILPNSLAVRRGLSREDLFVAVHEHFMTDTARLADLVLPATMFVEHDDIYTSGGHGHLQIGRKLIEPPGECRSNHEVVQALARRLGATHPGFGMTALELCDATLRASGWPGAEELTERRWVDAQPSFADSHFLNGFGHPDGKFRFRADWAALGPYGGLPSLPDHADMVDQATAERPFRLVTAPARNFLNTSFTQSSVGRRRQGRPEALIHPDDAERLGAAPGGRLRLGNALGELVLDWRAFDGLQPGTVVVESLWPASDFEGGVGINALISDDPVAPAGGAVFHDTAIWVRAEAAAMAMAAE